MRQTDIDKAWAKYEWEQKVEEQERFSSDELENLYREKEDKELQARAILYSVSPEEQKAREERWQVQANTYADYHDWIELHGGFGNI